MYTIEHLSEESWTPEVTRETEFKAFVDARTKCMATGKIYRVVDDKHNVRYTIFGCVTTFDQTCVSLR